MKYYQLLEDLNKINFKFYHVSDFPEMKFNYNSFHNDPIGIYAFPSDFLSNATIWKNKKYKFEFEIDKTAKLLIINENNINEYKKIYNFMDNDFKMKFDNLVKMYPPKNNLDYFKMLWKRLQAYFAYEKNGIKNSAEFTKLFINLHYDGIYDEFKIIHSSEKQLIIFNKKIIKNIKLIENTYSKYNFLLQLIEYFKNLDYFHNYEIKKIKNDYIAEIIYNNNNAYLNLKIFCSESIQLSADYGDLYCEFYFFDGLQNNDFIKFFNNFKKLHNNIFNI